MRALKFLLVPFVVVALAGAAVCAELTIVYNDGLIRGPQCPLRDDKPSFVRSSGDIVVFADCNGATVAPPGLALTVTPVTLPAGKVGVTYNQTVTLEAAAGTPPYKFTCASLVSGIPSPQAVVDANPAKATCTFAGIPGVQSPTDKPFDLFFAVEDSSVPLKSDVQRLTVAVEPAPVPACQLTNWQNCTTCFSAWAPDPCASGTMQNRSAVSTPLGCIAQLSDAPQSLLSRTCNTQPPACTYTYSDWGQCTSGIQTRTVISQTPAGCAGTPVLQQSCSVLPPGQGTTLQENVKAYGTLPANGTALYRVNLSSPCATIYKKLVAMLTVQQGFNLDMVVEKSWNGLFAPPKKEDHARLLAQYGYKGGADGVFFFNFSPYEGEAVAVYANYPTFPGFNQADTYYILLVNPSTTSTPYSVGWYCN